MPTGEETRVVRVSDVAIGQGDPENTDFNSRNFLNINVFNGAPNLNVSEFMGNTEAQFVWGFFNQTLGASESTVGEWNPENSSFEPYTNVLLFQGSPNASNLADWRATYRWYSEWVQGVDAIHNPTSLPYERWTNRYNAGLWSGSAIWGTDAPDETPGEAFANGDVRGHNMNEDAALGTSGTGFTQVSLPFNGALDSAQGASAEYAPQIFNPFFTASLRPIQTAIDAGDSNMGNSQNLQENCHALYRESSLNGSPTNARIITGTPTGTPPDRTASQFRWRVTRTPAKKFYRVNNETEKYIAFGYKAFGTPLHYSYMAENCRPTAQSQYDAPYDLEWEISTHLNPAAMANGYVLGVWASANPTSNADVVYGGGAVFLGGIRREEAGNTSATFNGSGPVAPFKSKILRIPSYTDQPNLWESREGPDAFGNSFRDEIYFYFCTPPSDPRSTTNYRADVAFTNITCQEWVVTPPVLQTLYDAQEDTI